MAYLSRHERREQIVNAVVDIVGREGLSAATVRRIAQELDCSPGQIHHHFASADALRAEGFRETWARISPFLVERLDALEPRERLLILLSKQACTSNPELLEHMIVADRLWSEAWDSRRDPEVRAAISESLTLFKAFVIKALQEGQQKGIFSQDLEVEKIAGRLMTSVQGYSLWEEIGMSGELATNRTQFSEDLLRREGL